MVMLPTPSETAGAWVEAMNGQGLVGGYSSDFSLNLPPQAVIWRDATGPVVELGIGGIRRADGSSVHGQVVDINAAGVVAVDRIGYGPNGRRVRASAALLWEETSGTVRLPAPARRPRVWVSALNDHGTAVGSAGGRATPSVPVRWRRGQVRRLPLPPGAESGDAVDINNRGLILGALIVDGSAVPWWWGRFGRSGPLPGGSGWDLRVVAVDDRNRFVGNRDLLGTYEVHAYLWRHRSASPRRIFDDVRVYAMDSAGRLAGASDGFRARGARAWVGRVRGRVQAWLPDPLEDPLDPWINTFASAVARGVSDFAPQGGITVAGQVHAEEGPYRPVLWTCTQTYFE
jgi:hypothetical protein